MKKVHFYSKVCIINLLYGIKKKDLLKNKSIILYIINNVKLFCIINYATYNNRKAIIKANKPVASEKANPKIA